MWFEMRKTVAADRLVSLEFRDHFANAMIASVAHRAFVAPFIGVILGWTFSAEHPTVGMLIGTLLVVGSMFGTRVTEWQALAPSKE